jgi:glycosyltransferase involved in cell wall biosynthesis
MKILVLSSTYPYPLDTGSRNLVYHWTQFLSRQHRVSLLVITEEEVPNGAAIPGLGQVAVETVCAVPGRSVLQRAARFAESWGKGTPPAALVVTGSRFVELVRSRIRSDACDVVVLAENNVAGYARRLKGRCPVVLFKHSVQLSDAEDDRRRSGKSGVRAQIARSVVRRFEAESCAAADAICTVTEEDAAALERIYGLGGEIRVVPIGVDLSVFTPRLQDPGGEVIGFYGNLAWGANVDAVLWFAAEVLPRVLERQPQTVFRVIGPGGDGLRAQVHHPRVEFQGPVVPVTRALQDVAVGVVPVISGTGMRFKFVEMLSMGIPTVTTTLGMVRTGCVHGRHALIADDAESFAAAVVQLLDDAALREMLSRSAAELARQHSWEAVGPKVLEAVESSVRGVVAKGTGH